MQKGLEKAQVLITTGGVSMGEKDLIKPILEQMLLAQIHFGRLQIKPGKPTTFATIKDKVVFGLPGNPVSALVMFYIIVLPMLRKMSGDDQTQLFIPARLTRRIARDQRMEFQRCHLRNQAGIITATPFNNQNSSALKSLSTNGLIQIPASTEKYLEEGSIVNAIQIQ